MEDLKAKDIMTTDLITINENLSVKEVSRILLEKKIGGAPVLNDAGEMVGLVTEEDLIMQDVKLHFPTYLHFLDSYIYLGGLKKFEEDLKKAVGAKVEEVMTKEVVCVDENDSIKNVATVLVNKKLTRVPVLKEGKLVGIITKTDIMRTIAES
ncbi:MAG TPA: CBS domain-containing protein [Actinobacteria bacterium]|nr:CBS domain-containing protein [Actinomycetota bacterium]